MNYVLFDYKYMLKKRKINKTETIFFFNIKKTKVRVWWSLVKIRRQDVQSGCHCNSAPLASCFSGPAARGGNPSGPSSSSALAPPCPSVVAVFVLAGLLLGWKCREGAARQSACPAAVFASSLSPRTHPACPVLQLLFHGV